MALTVRFAAKSDRGLIREGNEDSLYAGSRLLAVADGMGGHAAGEVASAVAIQCLAPLDDDVPGSDLLAALGEAVHEANTHLQDMVRGDGTLEGMGTTLTAILVAGSRLGLVHVGDSRAYLLRDGELTQITRDDTLVQSMVDEGRITEEEAGSHPQRSLITKALDGRGEVEPHLSVREARAGDRYLLCTDGLSGLVSLDTLRETLKIPVAQEAIDRLIDLALRGGGPDNITGIVADVVDAGDDHGAPVVAGAAARNGTHEAAPSNDSAAGRAALAEGRRARPPGAHRAVSDQHDPHERADRRRARWRTAIASLVALVVLVAGGVAGWSYVQAQYYVGVDQTRVAIFRGVSGSFAGVALSRVAQHSTVTIDRLPPFEQQAVSEGITARDRRDAEAIVTRLCDEAAATATAAPTPTPAATPAPTPCLAAQ